MRIESNITTGLAKIPNKVKLSEFPLTKLDLSAIDGIQKDIPLFEGVKIEDIAFITKHLETLNLFRGCKLGCSHCLKNAMAPKHGRESILFEDLRRFTLGFKNLSERLGFDVLNGNKYLNIIDDSNPIDSQIKGLNRNHGVAEAIKLIYDRLHIPTLFVTSGWTEKRNGDYQYSQAAAKSIVNMVKKNPDSVVDVQISVNPFLRNTNSNQNSINSSYVNRIARAITTFLDLFKIDKASLIYRHAQDGYDGYDANSTKQLYEAIFKKVQEMANSTLEGFPQLAPENVTKFDKSHLIEPSGRGRKFFSFEQNMKLQQELIQDSMDWGMSTKDEQRKILLNNALKCIDIDGSVYTTKPSSAEFVASPIEITIPTDIKLNYINKEKPNPIFSDIEV